MIGDSPRQTAPVEANEVMTWQGLRARRSSSPPPLPRLVASAHLAPGHVYSPADLRIPYVEGPWGIVGERVETPTHILFL